MMKKYSNPIATLLFIFLTINVAMSQNVGINEDNSSPNAQAILDIKSTTKGVLLPRMTTTQRTAMSLNLTNTGMIVYDTSIDNYFFWNGMEWEYFGGSSWLSNATGVYSFPLSGNVGIGSTPVSISKLTVLSEDKRYGINTSAQNISGSTITGNFISVNSEVDATREGLSIIMPSSGGFGIKRGVYLSLIHI